MSLLQLEAYAITLVVEGIVAYLVAPLFKVSARRAALSAVVGSAISHPIFWPSAYALYDRLGTYTIPILETFVVLFESIVYRILATGRWPIALALSVIANFSSWLVGRLLV